jgi:hypothetical protein
MRFGFVEVIRESPPIGRFLLQAAEANQLKRWAVVIVGELWLLWLLMMVVLTMLDRDSTWVAPSFQERAYKTVAIGDTKADVIRLLGLPLVSRDEFGHVILRGPDRTKGIQWKYTCPGRVTHDHIFDGRDIVFDKEGRVLGKEAYHVGE